MKNRYAKDPINPKYGQRVVQSKKRKATEMSKETVDQILDEVLEFLALESIFNAMGYYHKNVEPYWSDAKWDTNVTNLVKNRHRLPPELKEVFDKVSEYHPPYSMRFLELDDYKTLLEDW